MKTARECLTRYGKGMTKAMMVRGTRQLAVSVVVTVPTLLGGVINDINAIRSLMDKDGSHEC